MRKGVGAGIVALALAAGVLSATAGVEIHNASAAGDLDRVKNLVSRSPALIHATDKLGRKPIHYAAQFGRDGVVEFLISQKAQVDARVQKKAPDGGMLDWTPLHLAAESGRISTMKILLTHGADINARDFLGRTPLFLAVMQDQTEAVRFLLENGADPNVADRNGKTPLRRALEREHGTIVGLLQQAGASE